MRALVAVAVFAVGCSSPQSPTAPTATPTPTPVTVAPPVVTPPAAPTNPLLSDSRFSLSFYRQFVRNAYDSPAQLEPLKRQATPPSIYIRTIDSAGNPIDQSTIDQTAAAIERTTGQFTGVFGIAKLERGTATHEGEAGWITVKWNATQSADALCGRAPVGGTWIELYPRNPCRCGGGPAVALRVVKHELGHALGFWHTDSKSDLMFIESNTCDQEPSAREQFHGRIAYEQPIGSLDPK